MLKVFTGANRYCDGLSRRDFLQIGAVAFGGLTLADVFRAEALGKQLHGKKSLINVYLGGGPSHLDMWEIKSEAPVEFRGEFTAIDTKVPGIRICQHLPKLAGMMDKLCVVRSISGMVDEHSADQTETGWRGDSLKPLGGRPSIGSAVAKLHGLSNGSAPTFVDLAGVGRPGFIGPVYRPFRPDGQGRSNLRLQGEISVNRLSDRRDLLAKVDRIRRDSDNSRMMEAMDSFTDRAIDIVTSAKVAQALDVEKEDAKVRERYGRDGNERFLLARRLVEVGVRVVSLSWGGWDTHSDNFKTLSKQLPRLDQGLSALVEELDYRGMLEDTAIVVWGEFGRTPRVNSSAGRDHWSRVASCLLAGGGMKMGQAIGSTNRLGEVAQDRPVQLQEIFATLYHVLGVNVARDTIPDPNGRPQFLTDLREPIRELV